MPSWRPVDYSKGGPYICEVCSYARPASEGPKGGLTDRALNLVYGTKQYQVWCPKKGHFVDKNVRNKSCGSWHYGE